MFVKSLYKKLLAASLIMISLAATTTQLFNEDFGLSFGNKYTKAQQYLNLHQDAFTPYTAMVGVNEKFMKAIVFPEVMRYNEVYDGIQTESLKVLYKEWGTDYANFSIGHFQMKPSFALQVEKQMTDLLTPGQIRDMGFDKILSAPEITQRSLRLQYLDNTAWQAKYLTAFIMICNARFEHKIWASDQEKLAWYASLYNRGINCSDASIKRSVQQASFYLEKGMPGKKYCYAAIAQYFYMH